MADINTFSTPPARDGTSVISTVDIDELVSRIQSDSTDEYFNGSEDFYRVSVIYRHEDGRQAAIIKHRMSDGTMSGSAMWSDNARDGTWEKVQVKSEDYDGAVNILGRSAIGTGEDLFLA
jgi:hypothetical protein